MSVLRLLPRFRKAQRELSVLEAREQWSRSDINTHQLEQVNRLWSHAIEFVPYYRRLADTMRLPAKFTTLGEFQQLVPRLEKNEVRQQRHAFLSAQAGRGAWYLTGGSTGAPTQVFRSHVAHREMLWARYRFHAMWGLDLFDCWAFLWGHGASFAPGIQGLIERAKQPIQDWLRSRLRLSAYRLGPKDLAEHLTKLEEFQPAGIYGYSTAVWLLCRQAEVQNFRCDSLKLITLTAEPAFPHIVETCERAMGVPAVVEYGSAECGVMSFEGPDRTLRVREDNILLETIPRQDGRYDIVVTVLNNPSFPLIRYSIGDITDAPLAEPKQGFAVLKNVGGRDNDVILGESGQSLHSMWFDDVLEHYKAMRRYQIHQQAAGNLIVQLELTKPDAALDTRQVERLLAEHVGYPVTVRIVDKLPGTSAGKHRWITSDMVSDASTAHVRTELATTNRTASEHR